MLAIWDRLVGDITEDETLTAGLAANPYDAKHASSERKRYDALTEERAQLLAARPDLAQRVAAARARIDALRETEKAGPLDEAREAVKELERELVRLREKLAVANAEPAHDQTHLDDVAAGGPKTPCPICKKPYGAEYDTILDGYRRRIAANERLVPEVERAASGSRSVREARDAHDDARAAGKKPETPRDQQTLQAPETRSPRWSTSSPTSTSGNAR